VTTLASFGALLKEIYSTEVTGSLFLRADGTWIAEPSTGAQTTAQSPTLTLAEEDRIRACRHSLGNPREVCEHCGASAKLLCVLGIKSDSVGAYGITGGK